MFKSLIKFFKRPAPVAKPAVDKIELKNKGDSIIVPMPGQRK